MTEDKSLVKSDQCLQLFSQDVFCNIGNGVHASPSVNCDNAKANSESILEMMVVDKVSDYSY